VRSAARWTRWWHSLAFANREDLTRPFLETGRAGFLLAQNVSAYSLGGGGGARPRRS